MVGVCVKCFPGGFDFCRAMEERSLGDSGDGGEGMGIWAERMCGRVILERGVY